MLIILSILRNIRALTLEISKISDKLLANNKKVSVIICTDGEPTDSFTDGKSDHRALEKAFKELLALPVKVVIRICTDNEDVTNYWNKIDNFGDIDIDVIDDLKAEAEDIFNKNKWFTYGMLL